MKAGGGTSWHVSRCELIGELPATADRMQARTGLALSGHRHPILKRDNLFPRTFQS